RYVGGALLPAEGPALCREIRRRGGRVGAIKNPHGSVTFALREGFLTEFTLTLSGSRRIFDSEVRLDRTATTRISEIGSAKVEVHPGASVILWGLTLRDLAQRCG